MIEFLTGPDRIRRRANILFDPLDARGCLKALKMLLENAVDEALLGHCNRVSIFELADGVYQIADPGRGIDCSRWEDVFCALYADSESEKDAPLRKRYQADSYRRYGFHLAAVQFVCQWMEVEVYRNGTYYFMRFEKGLPCRNVFKTEPALPRDTGTRLRFQFDPEIFSEIVIPTHQLDLLARQTSMAVPGLEVVLQTDPQPYPVRCKRYCYPDGIAHPGMETFRWEGILQESSTAEPYLANAEAHFAFSSTAEQLHIHNHICLTGSLRCGKKKLLDVALERALKTVVRQWYPDGLFSFEQAPAYFAFRLRTYTQKTVFANADCSAIESKSLQNALLPKLTKALVRYLHQNRPLTESLLRQLRTEK